MGHKEVIESVESWPTSPSVERNTLDALIAIYQLLEERLPQEPMQTIVAAPAPVRGTVDSPLDGGMTFHCQSHNADTLTVRAISDGQYEVHAVMEVDDAETVIHLSAADAKRLARAILGAT